MTGQVDFRDNQRPFDIKRLDHDIGWIQFDSFDHRRRFFFLRLLRGYFFLLLI